MEIPGAHSFETRQLAGPAGRFIFKLSLQAFL